MNFQDVGVLKMSPMPAARELRRGHPVEDASRSWGKPGWVGDASGSGVARGAGWTGSLNIPWVGTPICVLCAAGRHPAPSGGVPCSISRCGSSSPTSVLGSSLITSVHGGLGACGCATPARKTPPRMEGACRGVQESASIAGTRSFVSANSTLVTESRLRRDMPSRAGRRAGLGLGPVMGAVGADILSGSSAGTVRADGPAAVRLVGPEASPGGIHRICPCPRSAPGDSSA